MPGEDTAGATAGEFWRTAVKDAGAGCRDRLANMVSSGCWYTVGDAGRESRAHGCEKTHQFPKYEGRRPGLCSSVWVRPASSAVAFWRGSAWSGGSAERAAEAAGTVGWMESW